MSDLKITHIEGVAVVRLDRPAARNALSGALRTDLNTTMVALDGDPTVRAIMLTGTDPAFCGGMDTKEIATNPESALQIGPRYRPLFSGRTPIIGAINGPAVTGGLELALQCDWLIASDRAVFADSHTRLGLTPGWGLTVLLTEAIGVRRARQLITSGMPIDATTALTWGLVNEVVPHEELLNQAMAHARAVSQNDPHAVGVVTQIIAEQRSLADASAWAVEARNWIVPMGISSQKRKNGSSA